MCFQGQSRDCRDAHGVRRCQGKRFLRVLALCNGCGAASLALRQLAVTAEVEVVVVERDPNCVILTQRHFPEEKLGWSLEVEDWASDSYQPVKGEEQCWFDLVVAGFPCQDVSTANRGGIGLKGDNLGSSLVFGG